MPQTANNRPSRTCMIYGQKWSIGSKTVKTIKYCQSQSKTAKTVKSGQKHSKMSKIVKNCPNPPIPQSPNPPISQSPNLPISQSPNLPISQYPNLPISQSPNPQIPQCPNPPIPQSPNPPIPKGFVVTVSPLQFLIVHPIGQYLPQPYSTRGVTGLSQVCLRARVLSYYFPGTFQIIVRYFPQYFPVLF